MRMSDKSGAAVEIRPSRTPAETAACADFMSRSQPWTTLGRTRQECLATLDDPSKELYVALIEGALGGFILVQMRGAFRGYIQIVAVLTERQGQGLGGRLLRFAEERIFREEPNVFICASSFNPRARKLYERSGYKAVGELKDYLVIGHSEILLRKTIGPLDGFKPSRI
jgi:ribosomal protein S18 acetylase RimI-like enzyme